MDSLQGRTALVTGASRGIGRACAVALAKEGATVAVNFRAREKEAGETCALIESGGGKAFPVRADVSEADEVETMMEAIRAGAGPVAILVNNAGIAIPRPVDELTEADFDEAIKVNLKSAFLVTQAALPAMREAGWGRIVNISSNAAYTGGSVGPHYAASKAGMNGLTRGYASRLAGEGITVNAVAPGHIETDMITIDMGIKTPRAPIGRFGQPEEVADVVAAMIRNGYITGQTLVINGGIYMK
ncbi:MAG: 3-oxoacyl-ACP reductase family protein [bacterium]